MSYSLPWSGSVLYCDPAMYMISTLRKPKYVQNKSVFLLCVCVCVCEREREREREGGEWVHFLFHIFIRYKSVENLLRKRLWTCHRTGYRTNEWINEQVCEDVINGTVFWEMMLCRLVCRHRRIGGSSCFHLHGSPGMCRNTIWCLVTSTLF